MNVFRKLTTDRVLLFIVFWCIYSFKIQLGGVGDAGLRPDDLLIALGFLLLLLKGALPSVRLTQPFKLYAIFVGVSVLSSLWNGLEGRVNTLYSVLFDVRLIEYMFFYYFGYYLAKRAWSGAIRKIIIAYFHLMVVIVPLQMLRIVPVATNFGFLRASGNTNGPYEFAAVASFLLCYLGYEHRSFLRGTSSGVLVVLSASRITSIGMVVSIYSYLFRLSRRNLRTAVLVFASLLLTCGMALVVSLNGDALADSGIRLFSRFGDAGNGNLATNFLEVYPGAPIYETSVDYLQGTFLHSCDNGVCDESLGDVSATIRIFKWTSLIKSTLHSVDSSIIGLGPSFASTAVDGNYVRTFAESGFVGLGIFLMAMFSFWQKRFKADWALREYVLILLISGIFIDIFTSYKTMILLWLWHGIKEGEKALEGATQDELEANHDAAHAVTVAA